MTDPIKVTGTHPSDGPGRTHRLTVYVHEQVEHRHRHALLTSECGFSSEVSIVGQITGTGVEPTCDECRTHGLSPKALSDVLGALARAGDL